MISLMSFYWLISNFKCALCIDKTVGSWSKTAQRTITSVSGRDPLNTLSTGVWKFVHKNLCTICSLCTLAMPQNVLNYQKIYRIFKMLYIKYIKVQKPHLSCKFNKLKENKYILSLTLTKAKARLSAVMGQKARKAKEYIF